MKKLTIISSFIAIIICSSCNKESIIEGYTTGATEVLINKSFAFNPDNTNTFNLSVGAFIIRFDVQNIIRKGLATTAAYTNTDSVRFTRIFIDANGFIAVQNNCAAKYTFGQDISSAIFSQLNPFNVIFSKKSSPYTTPYTSINTSFFFEKTIQPMFTLNEDAYIALKIKASNNGANNSFYYGWMHVIIGQNQITFDKMAYRLNTPLKAGQLDD